MIWDRLFGTYQAETEKVNYGVTTGFEGHNPAKLVLKPLYEFFMGRFKREKENLCQHKETMQPNLKKPVIEEVTLAKNY